MLPRSPMAGAIGYMLNQWDALCVYATRGFLAIDNNAAERALKRVAIGRKNWLFAGNDRAGQTTATLYSLIASAERHGVDPQRYLTSVLASLPSTLAGELEQFLPDVWEKHIRPVLASLRRKFPQKLVHLFKFDLSSHVPTRLILRKRLLDKLPAPL